MIVNVHYIDEKTGTIRSNGTCVIQSGNMRTGFKLVRLFYSQKEEVLI